MTRDRIRVIIVDDHDGVRAGIKNLLRKEKDIEVVGEGANGQEAVDLARQKNADVLLLDVELPIMRGEEVVRRVRKEKLPVKVLAVSSYDDRQMVHGMINNGAQGYITKEEATELLAEAVRRIHDGDPQWLSPRAAHYVASEPVRTVQSMTRREYDILQLLAKDFSEAEIARTLNLAPERLNNYLKVLIVKYGVDNSERLRSVSRNIFSEDPPYNSVH